MIYDSDISTGDTTISGCSSPYLSTNTFKSGNLIPAGALSSFFYDRYYVTGQREIKLSVNGQTFLQEVPITGQAVNYIDYQINTGDFFIKGEEADIVTRSQFYFDNTTPIDSSDSMTYSVLTGGNYAGTGDLGNSLRTSIIGGIGSSATFTMCDYFLNGQKVYSGFGVGVSAGTDGTDFIPHFGVGSTYGGVVTTSNKNKFKYTAYKRRDRTVSITGTGPDVFSNTGFIEGRTIFYINGLQQLQNSYLELYTGVNMVKSGITSHISGGFPALTQSSSLTL